MGFRFRKSIKILPGVRINVSNKGVSSVSVGKRGATLNVGKKGVRGTVGIPGSGLSYSSYTPYQQNRQGQRLMTAQNDNYDEYDEYDNARSVGLLLGIGIFLLPIVFAWFTLRQGHTTKARVISFVWLVLVTALSFTSKSDEPKPAVQPTPTQAVSAPTKTPPPTSQAHNASNGAVESDSKPMPFNEYVGLQKQSLLAVAGTGYKTSVIVDSSDLSVVRICTNDGSVLITCSRLDGKMVTTKSPHCP